MIGKRIVAVFLLFGILFSFSSCYSEDPSLISPILYEVSDDEGGKIWLFGSIHVGTEELYPLPRYVLKAFKKAKTLAVEFDLLKYKEDLNTWPQSKHSACLHSQNLVRIFLLL